MRGRILIVDDDPRHFKLAADVLEAADCAVQKAGDAEQALALLNQMPPDLILMDLALPGMSGLALARKLKADTRFKQIPIVALTDSTQTDDAVKARVAGCEDSIAKPIDPRWLAQRIFSFLPAQVTITQALPALGRERLILLIVDDVATDRRALRVGLEAEGHVAIEAANGAQALEVLENERVDAVISDIVMPKMDGFRLCREIRKSGKSYASLPFILHTATYNSPADRQLATTIGADGYILKPATIPAMLGALAEARIQAGGAKRPWAPKPSESYVLEQYNALLGRKLEERNTQLQQALAELQVAHAQILALERDAGAKSS